MLRLKVHTNGVVEGVYSDSLRPLMEQGNATVTRASHVEPEHREDGVYWYADLSPVGGPRLGPYLSRQRALTDEVKWLNDNIL